MYITIIEDQKKISTNLSKKLQNKWFNTNIINSYSNFKQNNSYLSDLYIIDTSIKDHNTLEIIHYLRDIKHNITPIIIISESIDIKEAIECLNIWADDYITKPFWNDEVIARVRALIRRSYKIAYRSKIKYKDFVFDTVNKIVSKNWTEIKLTWWELSLVEFLFFNQWKLVTKSKLICSVWWEHDLLNVSDNTINATISKVRKKLWSEFKFKTIVNKWYFLEK